jgi:hypothetical protein
MKADPNKVIRELRARVKELEAQVAALQPNTSREMLGWKESLTDGRPFFHASCGGIAHPWECLLRECQALTNGGKAPRVSGLPNKETPAGIADPNFSYGTRERAALRMVRALASLVIAHKAKNPELVSRLTKALKAVEDVKDETPNTPAAYVSRTEW